MYHSQRHGLLGLRKISMSLPWLSAFPEAQTSVQNMQIWCIYSTMLNFFYITLPDPFIRVHKKIVKCVLHVGDYRISQMFTPHLYPPFLDSIYFRALQSGWNMLKKVSLCNRLICLLVSPIENGCYVRMWCFSELSFKQISLQMMGRGFAKPSVGQKPLTSTLTWILF